MATLKYSGVSLLNDNEASLKRYSNWIVKRVSSYFGNVDGEAVVDFGAGIGTLSVIFKSQNPNAKIIALEVDDGERKILEDRGLCPVDSLEKIKEPISFVFSSNVLEHIDDDQGAIDAIFNKMSPGKLAVYVPAFENLWTLMDDQVGHKRRYTKKSLVGKLEKAGFIVDRVEYCDSIGFFLALIYKIFGVSGEPSRRSLMIFDRLIFPMSLLLDKVVFGAFGKNVFAFARRP